MGLRITSEDTQVIGKDTLDPHARFTDIPVAVMGGGNRSRVKTTAMSSYVLGTAPRGVITGGQHGQMITQAYAYVLATRNPNMKWIEMLQYEVFPNDISYNSTGSIKFATDVVQVDSGADQRNSRWAGPLRTFDITYAVRTMEQLQALQAFFLNMRGRRYSFLYFDHMDNSSSTAVRIEARAAPPPTMMDQVLGVGDGNTFVFQLQKTYTVPNGSTTYVRAITKPIVNSVLIAVAGTAVANWTVDRMTGLVTFIPRVNLTLASATLTPVTTGPSAGQLTISDAPGVFSNFVLGEKVVMTGWLNAVNNTTLGDTLTVASIAGDGSSINLAPALSRAWVIEPSHSGVNFYSHPAPANGLTVTSGFQFYIPARFDVDELPMRLSDFGVGDADNIKIVEVRPYSQ